MRYCHLPSSLKLKKEKQVKYRKIKKNRRTGSKRIREVKHFEIYNASYWNGNNPK